MVDVAELSQKSSDTGAELQGLWQSEAGVDRAQLVQQVDKLAARADNHVKEARKIEPPDGATQSHDWLVTTLQYRANGIANQKAALVKALEQQNDAAAAGAIVDANWRLIASDVVWEDSFVYSLGQQIRKAGIQPAELFAEGGVARDMDNMEEFAAAGMFIAPTPAVHDEFASARSIALALERLRSGKAAGKGKGGKKGNPNDGKLHGTGLASVVALPSGIALTPGVEAEIGGSEDLAVEVSIENQGEGQEVEIPVSVTLTSDSTEPVTFEGVIPVIDPGQTKPVRIALDKTPEFGVLYELVVKVEGVPGEQMVDNNAATYPVRFAL
jgi:hypothetical protein